MFRLLRLRRGLAIFPGEDFLIPTTLDSSESTGLLLDVIAPTQEDPATATRAAGTLARALRELPGEAMLHFVTPKGQPVEIPVKAARMLMSILEELAQGHTVALTSREEEISTREAAELLGVSRPHVVKLVDAGVLPHRMAGTHRRILLQDVLEYKRSQEERHSLLDALADEAQTLGLYK